MTITPIRGIASVGVIKDIPPQELPATAWTTANNVRFVNNSIRRAPGFRTFLTGLLTTAPHSFYSVSPQSSPDIILYTDINGRAYRRTTTGLHTDVSAAAHVDTSSTLPVSYAQLAGNALLAKATEQPFYLAPGGTQMLPFPAWTATHTAAVMRAYKGFLCAFNLTKVGVAYPTLVKTSDASVDGAMPTSWDHTDPTKLATENNLLQMTSPIVDAWPLGDDMAIYTSDQNWIMTFDGSGGIFSYRNTGVDKGVINLNCIQQVRRNHFVFGFNDIYTTDGISAESISNAKVKEYVYKNMDRKKADRFFTFHDERLSTVWFCFVSKDTDAIWTNASQCNRAAGFNYDNQTWSFTDLPNVCGSFPASTATIKSWATVAGTWASIGGTWFDQGEDQARIPVLASASLSGTPSITATMYAFDLVQSADAYVPSLTLDTAITPTVTLRKSTADVDDLGLTLAHYKTIKALYPQISGATATFQVRFGSQMLPNEAITWSAYQTFDSNLDYKVNTFTGGRLVSFEFKMTDTSSDFTLTALDIDISAHSKR